MAEDCVDRWNQICFGLISLTALLANVLLFFLVKNRTPQMMLSYRKVLYASCIFDGLAALSHLLISSRPSLEKDIAVMHFDGVLPQILDHFHLLPNGQLAYILAFESATQLNTFSYCFVPFAYRYFHIVWQTNFNKLKFFVLLLVYLSPTTIVAITLPVIAATTYDDMVKFVGERNDGCLRRVPFYDWRFLPVEPTASIAKNSYYPLLLTLLFPFVLCYFLIRIFQKLNEDVKKSSIAAHRMQRQITLTLTAQTFIFHAEVMAEICENSLHLGLSRFLSISGALANLLLLFLVRNHTPNVMKSYRKVLYGSCFLDGFMALEHLLVMGKTSIDNDVLAMRFIGPIPQLIDRLGWLPNGDLAYLLIPDFFFQMSSICYCFVPYTFRYFHIVRNATLNNFKFFVLIFVYLTPSLILSITIPLLSAHAYDQLNDYIGKDTSRCSRRVPIFDRRIVTSEPSHSVFQVCACPVLAMLAFPPILLYFIIRIYNKLNGDLLTTSAVTRRMQRQITITLTAQSIIPVLLISLPFFHSVASLHYSSSSDKAGSLALSSFSLNLIPLINPLATIWLLQSYRYTILKAVGIRGGSMSIQRVSVLSDGSLLGPPSSSVLA
ncbi:unnamed protein product [Bursaphelenchus xylophilus]|uniref:(pine wood nematode) hypothetical protein n=1 Tax=Bursaphelenchus xylophilus TaxID=6326 RepID=A0A7I8XMV5_BURXY|nr:unnamed protein product [Bursaphelenchus xylophilus]CAG9089273.1 unnamed protein product [Bursaphelenchus xylophilus]